MSDMPKTKMKKIGITGVIGAGKSSVIQILRQNGYTVLDCDRINDDLLLPNHKGYCQLVEAFHTGILHEDGTIDRLRMSDQIFSDPLKKQQAEAILHPLIKEEIYQQLNNHQKEALVFVEVPLLFEAGWESFFDEVWVVASEESLLLKRLMEYRGFEEYEARRRLNSQIPQSIKTEKADRVLWNNSDIESLTKQIYAILEEETKR